MAPQHSSVSIKPNPGIHVRPLQEDELNDADHIMRLAFGTFLGIPEPASFMGDANFVHTRWKANPDAAFAAEVDGKLIGSNFASNWGSVGFFWPADDSSGSLGPGCSATTHGAHHGMLYKMGYEECRPFHFCTKCQTYQSLPEVWLLAAIPDTRHVQTGGTGT